MDITVSQRKFEEINEFPRVVYKYRTWSNQWHQSILKDQIVFMAAPTDFEDKKDCKLLKRYDLMTEEDMYNWYLKESLSINSGWTMKQHQDIAKVQVINSTMKNQEEIKKMQEEHFFEFCKQFGVLSLTANCLRMDMWEKYSENHSGFCVGFKPKEMFLNFTGGGEVSYHENLPDIFHNDSFEMEYAKQIYSKEKQWEFEKEYRTHKFSQDPMSVGDRSVKLPKSCFARVIFGAKIPVQYREEIIKVCLAQDLKVEFFDAVISSNNAISLIKAN